MPSRPPSLTPLLPETEQQMLQDLMSEAMEEMDGQHAQGLQHNGDSSSSLGTEAHTSSFSTVVGTKTLSVSAKPLFVCFPIPDRCSRDAPSRPRPASLGPLPVSRREREPHPRVEPLLPGPPLAPHHPRPQPGPGGGRLLHPGHARFQRRCRPSH